MEDEDFLAKLKNENATLRETNTQMSQAASSYQGEDNNNLIQYQVETAEMLGKIEHFLRGEYITTDDEQNEYWTKPTKTITNKKGKEETILNEDLILFNEYGVNAIMSIIGNYLDKNTILSFYDEMRINEILADLGDELGNFLYCNYEKMGMNTDFKKSKFILTVLNIIHSIESAYRRSLGGKTMEDLNSAKIFTQMDHMGNSPSAPTKKRFNPFSPKTW